MLNDNDWGPPPTTSGIIEDDEPFLPTPPDILYDAIMLIVGAIVFFLLRG